MILFLSFIYLALLFVIAYLSENRASLNKKSLTNNPYFYSLSLAVYCTAWTYYGSVGAASKSGIEFIAIYIGPTIFAPLWWLVLRKIIRISKVQRISNIADFISARYGKNTSIGGLVTFFCAIGIIPYISLQIKAIAITAGMMVSDLTFNFQEIKTPILNDIAFYITIILAVFVILFGTSQVESSEKHEGLVTAVVFESIVKLIAFLAVGVFIVYFVFDGFTDLFSQALAFEGIREIFEPHNFNYPKWMVMIFLSMGAIILLPRQFQMAVIENTQEEHIKKAMWLFPLYLLLINVFVLPIALGGMVVFNDASINADNFVLAIPKYFGNDFIAILVFLGGLSAASSMVIVSTISLSIMISNNLVVPSLLNFGLFKDYLSKNSGNFLLGLRHINILIILILAFVYYKWITKDIGLVSIGLISFAAVSQFIPATILGIFWKGGSKKAAQISITIGFILWFYTLVIPTIVNAGFLPQELLSQGLFGQDWLRPQALFGLEGFDPLVHAVFWSLGLNFFSFILVSLYTDQTSIERNQAEIFVDIFKYSTIIESSVVWKGKAQVKDLKQLLYGFLGKRKVDLLFKSFISKNKISINEKEEADSRLVNYSEKLLAGVIGVSSSRVLISSVVKEEEIRMSDVFGILKESQELIKLNNQLSKKSEELRKASNELKVAYQKLRELDERKDEFISTVTHEMRTPLTVIRSFTEILNDQDDLEDEEKEEFLNTIIKEIDRMERLISQVLDIERIQSGKIKLNESSFDLNEVIKNAVSSMEMIMKSKEIQVITELQDFNKTLIADKDKILQILLNLLSNAVKFGVPEGGEIKITSYYFDGAFKFKVADNGRGIDPDVQKLIFDPFFQAKNQTSKKPKGSGLGLAICKSLVQLHKGEISLESEIGKGTRFTIEIPARVNNEAKVERKSMEYEE